MKLKFFIFGFIICNVLHAAKLKPGVYRGILLIDTLNKIELPFNFNVEYVGKKPIIIIKNATEKITVTEIKIKKDSVFFKMPVFDTEFRAKIIGDDWQGVWINNYRTEKRLIPFKADYENGLRFISVPGKANPYFEGKWETTFSPGTKDSSKAIGIFHHLEQTDFIHGTFLTETGDYRFLEGIKKGNEIYLSCFDGSHAFLFIGKYTNEKIKGMFYSGMHWKEEWVATKNESFKLRDANEITFVKNRGEKLNFTFENLENKKISITDERYKNKPLIIQVMGSWCPNCMDESAYLAEVYKKYKTKGLEIIALAFEKTSDFEKAKKQVTRFKTKLNIEYEVLITQLSGKQKASETLSVLNEISSFPTTIFLNKNHEIVKIHTGFSGPATGKEYEIFKENTEVLINHLIKE